MKRICVVNINWLGDAIFTTPVFKAIKEAHPQAHVACMCVPRVQEVLRYCPYIDEIIVYDEKGTDRWPWRKWQLINRLRKEKFDIAFMLHRSLSRGVLVFLAGIPQRVGYTKAKWLLTYPVQDTDAVVHRSDNYTRVVELFGIPCIDRRNQLTLDPEDMGSMDSKLRDAGIGPGERYMVFNIGGNWDLKRWPRAHWAELTKRVLEGLKIKIIFSGALKDEETINQVIRDSAQAAINFAGKTSLGESLALFQRAKVVVSADSGPLHLANAVGASVVGIFGPTRVEVTGPRGSGESIHLFKDVGCNKAPCYHLACANNVCMQSIGVEDVWQAIQKFIR